MKRLHLNCIGKSALLLLLASFLPMTTWAQDNNPTNYGLSVNGTDVTSNNEDNVLGDGKVSYDPGLKALTLDTVVIQQGAGIIVSSNFNSDSLTINLIESTIETAQGAGISVMHDVNLTINLIGNNSIVSGSKGDGCIRTLDGSQIVNATLAFTKGGDNCRLELSDYYSNIPIAGFQTVTLGTYLIYEGYYTYGLNANFPGFNVLYNKDGSTIEHAAISSGEPIWWSEEGPGGRVLKFNAVDAGKLHYSINYVDDENYVDVDDDIYDFDHPVEILLAPCTVTAYVKVDEYTGTTVTGKFFGFNQSVVDATPNTSVVPPSVVPALPSGATMSYSVVPANSYVTYNSTNGKFDITGTGNYDVSGTITMPNAPSQTITILNIDDGNGGYIVSPFQFNVVAKSLDLSMVADIPNRTFDGDTITPAVTVMHGDYKLQLFTDYTVMYYDNVNASTSTNARVEITGKGNYYGTVIKYFTIDPKSISTGYTVNLATEAQSFTYTAGEIRPAVTLSTTGAASIDPSNYPDDFEVAYSNNIDAATPNDANPPTVTVTGKGNYTGSASAKFTITARDIANATIVDIVNQNYTSKLIQPELNVTDGNKTLVLDTDYEVSYTSNINVGTATATITGKGNYTSTKSKNFEIVAVSLEGVTVDPIPDQTYTSNPIQPTLTVTFNGNPVASDEYTAVYTNNTNFGQATVTLTSTGQNFTASSQKIVHFNIGQATATLSGTDQEVTYDGQEQPYTNGSTTGGTLVVTYYPNADARSKGSNAIGVPVNAGTYYVRLTQGNNNFTSTPVDVTLTINPAAITELTLSETVLTYTGSEQTVGIASVKAGMLTLGTGDYTVSGNTATAANNYTVTVTGKGNYTSTKSKNFEIVAVSLEGVDVDPIPNQTYTGQGIEPPLTVTFNGNAVASDEYTAVYTNNTNATSASQATVTLTSTGKNFTAGTQKIVHFNIGQKTATLSGTDQEETYDGEEQPYTNGSTTGGTLVVTYYPNADARSKGSNAIGVPVNAGTYYVRLTQGDNNFTSTPVDVTLTINPAAITELILSETVLTYTGSEQTVGIASVKAGSLTLKPDDYTVSGNTAKDPGPYTVTVTAKANGNFSGFATAGFTIVNRTLTVDDIAFANGQTFASFFTAAEDFDLSAGLVAHVITGVDGNSVTTQALSYVPKNVPVLIEKTTETVQTNNNVGNNLLRGTSAPTAVSSITDGTVYVLYNNEFVRAVTGTIPANRSYLVLNDKNAGARLRIVHDSDATAIDALDANADTDMNVWYDQSGRKLQGKPTRKGLYIQNGKKVVIK